MPLHLDRSLFVKDQEKDRIVWFIHWEKFKLEVTVPDNGGTPDEESIILAQDVIDHLEELQDKAIFFFEQHLTFQKKYQLIGIEMLSAFDRHGARIILTYNNDQDGYLLIEAGINQTHQTKREYQVAYAVVTYC